MAFVFLPFLWGFWCMPSIPKNLLSWNLIFSRLPRRLPILAFLGLFFFVLSGFIISYLLFKEKHELGKIRLGYFYFRRVLRIWPLYFLVLLIGFGLVPATQPLLGNASYEESAALWPFLLYINNFFRPPETAILGVLWSIAFEEQFYVFWPLVLKVVKPRITLGVIVGLIILSVILRTWVIGWGYLHSLSCMSDLCMGAALAWVCYFMPQQRDRLANRLSRAHIAGVYILGLSPFCVSRPIGANEMVLS